MLYKNQLFRRKRKQYSLKERIVRIVKPDNTAEMVMINGKTTYKGKEVFFDPNIGRYDINVEVGPSFQSKLEQTFELLTELAQANPQIVAVAGDLIMRAAPLPGNLGLEIADRMKAILPPAVAAIANGEKPPDPQSQAQLMQATQMIQMLTQQVQQMGETIRTKKYELESKERIASQQAIVTLLAAELKAKTESAQMLTQLEFDSIRHRLELLHDSVSMDAEMDQRKAEADQQAAIQKAQPKAA